MLIRCLEIKKKDMIHRIKKDPPSSGWTLNFNQYILHLIKKKIIIQSYNTKYGVWLI